MLKSVLMLYSHTYSLLDIFSQFTTSARISTLTYPCYSQISSTKWLRNPKLKKLKQPWTSKKNFFYLRTASLEPESNVFHIATDSLSWKTFTSLVAGLARKSSTSVKRVVPSQYLLAVVTSKNVNTLKGYWHHTQDKFVGGLNSSAEEGPKHGSWAL